MNKLDNRFPIYNTSMAKYVLASIINNPPKLEDLTERTGSIRSHHQPFVQHAARIPHAIKGDIQMLAGTFTNPMLDVYEQCASNVKKLVGEVSRSD